jgi:hypothetical protein
MSELKEVFKKLDEIIFDFYETEFTQNKIFANSLLENIIDSARQLQSFFYF